MPLAKREILGGKDDAVCFFCFVAVCIDAEVDNFGNACHKRLVGQAPSLISEGPSTTVLVDLDNHHGVAHSLGVRP